MTTSMMLDDLSVVKDASHNARKIDGIDSLNISKSKAVIVLFSPEDKYTTNPLLLDVLTNKATKLIKKMKTTIILFES